MKVFGDKNKILIGAEEDEKLSLLEMSNGAMLIESVKKPKRRRGYIRIKSPVKFTKN